MITKQLPYAAAHWATKIARPRQVYAGEEVRDFLPIADRGVRQLVNA